MKNPFHISLLMKMITDRVDALMTKELALQHVTAAQGRVLAFLITRDGERATQKELECYLGVSHTTAKGLVLRLEEKGMVRTAFDNEDGRVKSIYLTDRSRAMHREIETHAERIENSLLKGLSADEREQFTNLIHRLYDNIQ